MRRRISLGIFIIFISSFVILTIRSILVEDPDFGWHLRVGNYILENGIPLNDPFSYSMPSYRFVDHEWLADVLVTQLLRYAPFMFVHGLFSFFAITAIWILWRNSKKEGAEVIFFLAIGTLFEFIGIRMQIISWLLLALLMTILSHERFWNRWKYAIPFLFLLWANLHGGFAIGYTIFALFMIGNWIEKKRFSWSEYNILVISGLATIMNPYGLSMWEEVSKSFTDTSLRWTIQEWYPAIYFTNIAFWIYALISWMLLLRYWKRFPKTQLGIFLLLFVSGMASMRNIPLFVIVSYIMTMKAIAYFAQEAAKFPFGKERFQKAYQFFLVMSFFLFLPQVGLFFYGTFIQDKGESSYPYQAISYLKEHMPSGNIFAAYDIGGFLLWQLPEKKVFIDGRMPSWKNERASSRESTYAFGEYRALLSNKLPFSVIQEKYAIDTVIVPVGELEKKKVIILGMDAEKNPLLKKLFVRDLSFSYLIPQMKKALWKEVYKDKKVVIYQPSKQT